MIFMFLCFNILILMLCFNIDVICIVDYLYVFGIELVLAPDPFVEDGLNIPKGALVNILLHPFAG